MSCTLATYDVTTSETHTPTWNGTLAVTAATPPHNGTFTLTGASSGTTTTVICGTNPTSQLPTIAFTCNGVHYKTATRQASSNPPIFSGAVDDTKSPGAGTDTWTAETVGNDEGHGGPKY